MPTWHIIPKKHSAISGFFSNPKQSAKLEGLPVISSSCTLSRASKTTASTETTANTGNSTCHFPKCTAPHAAKIGATKDAIALTNCPNVSAPDNFSSLIKLDTNGFSDTCIIVLPMPSRQNDTTITGKV